MNIADITPGSYVHAVFLVASVEVREARTGNRFLRMSLRDRAGASIDAVMFQVTEAQIAAVTAGEPYEVEGRADEFRNRVNIKVDALRRSDETWDATAYLPRSTRSPEELTGSIRDAVESIESPVLKDVLRAVIADPLGGGAAADVARGQDPASRLARRTGRAHRGNAADRRSGRPRLSAA